MWGITPETRIRLRAAEHHHNPGERAECFSGQRAVAVRCVASAPWDNGDANGEGRPDCSEKDSTALGRDAQRGGVGEFQRSRRRQFNPPFLTNNTAKIKNISKNLKHRKTHPEYTEIANQTSL